MSCNTPTSSAQSLSPSDESRFVPHSSIVDVHSVAEQHFAASTQAEKDAEKVEEDQADVNKTSAVSSSTIQGTNKGPTLVVVGSEKSGIVGGTPGNSIARSDFAPPPNNMSAFSITNRINSQVGSSFSSDESRRAMSQKSIAGPTNCALMGATICYTPKPSPPSSPIKRDVPNLDSVNTNMNYDIGSVDGLSSGVEGVASRMSSSAMQVASSLDGRSNTSYEILDGLSSKGTIEVGDLILEGEEDDEKDAVSSDKERVKSDIHFNDAAARAVLANLSLSPSSTLPSLDGGGYEHDAIEPPSLIADPVGMLKSPQPAKTNTSQVLPDTNHPIQHIFKGIKLDLSSDDATNEKTREDEDSPKTSPKVDESLLTPFKSLHRYWEAQETLTRLTKSAVERLLQAETSKGIDLDANEETQVNPDADIREEIEVDRLINDGLKTSVNTSPIEPQDINVGGTNEGYAEQREPVKVTPNTNTCTISFCIVVCTVVSFIRVFLLGLISPALAMVKVVYGVLLCKAGTTGQVSVGAPTTSEDDADQATTHPEDPLECNGTNLSKLFSDEALASGVGQYKGSSNTADMVELEQKDKALINGIKDEITTSIMMKYKKRFSVLKSTRVGCAIASIAFIAIMLMHKITMHKHQFKPYLVGVSHTTNMTSSTTTNMTSSTALPAQAFEPVLEQEDDIRCFETHTASFVSIPLWEFELSPTSFESFYEEELFSEQTPGESGSMSWLCVFFYTSLVCALMSPFSPTNAGNQTENLTGTWTVEEHAQFMEGYNEHGSRWKLVSAYVPSRSATQVKSHGNYWLKIGSPSKMKKTRNTNNATPKSSGRKTTKTPNSVLSTNSTPRKSNKTTPAPLKGILIERDNNQMCKHITPRSEGRTRRTRNTRGSKSEPSKRVRIQDS